MRLTLKDKKIRDNFNAEYAKLADLEDIEEKLGVDLITLFKAVLGFGFYSKNGFEKIEETEVDFILKCFYTIDQDAIYFKDYGKTWSLTKEMLK